MRRKKVLTLLRWLLTLVLLAMALKVFGDQAIPVPTEVEVSVTWATPETVLTSTGYSIYLPFIMNKAPADVWPTPKPTPTPCVVPMGKPLESIGYAYYYSADGQRWNFYTDVTMSPDYPFTANDMVMLGFRAWDIQNVVIYVNDAVHLADPSWVAPGETTRIAWDVPADDVPQGIAGFWFLLRWR